MAGDGLCQAGAVPDMGEKQVSGTPDDRVERAQMREAGLAAEALAFDVTDEAAGRSAIFEE